MRLGQPAAASAQGAVVPKPGPTVTAAGSDALQIASSIEALTEAGKNIYLTQKTGEQRIKEAKKALKKPVTVGPLSREGGFQYWWLIPIGVVGLAGVIALLALRRKS